MDIDDEDNIPIPKDYKITEEDVEFWGREGLYRNLSFYWFAEVLNGEVSVEDHRENILSILFSKKYGNKI